MDALDVKKQSTNNSNTVKTDIQSVVDALGTKKDGVTTQSASDSFYQATKFSINNHPQPFFYHTNSTKHTFTLHAPPSHYTYPTTLSLILFLHLLYLYQWNKRLSRSDLATNYDQLVNRRQYWRGLLAIISHPPVEGGERDVGLNDYNRHSSGDVDSEDAVTSNSVTRRFAAAYILYNQIKIMLRTRCAPLGMLARRILHPLFFGHLSGLPLLAYISHILWKCRALEEIYNIHDGRLILGVEGGDHTGKFVGMASHVISLDSDAKTKLYHDDTNSSYFRVLVALATVAILLEVSLLRTILRRMDRHMDFTGYTTTPRTLLSQRAICSMTSLSAAVLSVYDAMFPHATHQVLPFIAFLSPSGFSLLFSIMILCILAHRIHPVTSVLSGLLSGSLFTLGVTSFLGTRYWGNAMISAVILAIVMSMKSNALYSTYIGMVLPCLDYVAWDEEGKIHDPSDASIPPNPRHGSSDMESELNDLETGQTSPSANGERRPLLPSTTDSTLSNDSRIRGRVPFINSMESDFDDGASNNTNNTGSRSDGNLSRRNRGM